MVKTKTTSFRIDNALLNELKLQAMKEDVSNSELIIKYIRQGLVRDRGQTTLDIE